MLVQITYIGLSKKVSTIISTKKVSERERERDMATIINCLRVVPKVTNTNTEPFVSLFTKRASRLAIVASFSSSTMSYEKELAAANKAASLAARLCQASLSCLYSLLVF